jgi:predicted alpha/beta superfamily hydrolase
VWASAPAACRTRACDLLVVLDAHALFPLATSYAAMMEAMGRMPPLVIIGIPSRTPAERIAQFTSSSGDEERARYPGAGGAPRFLRFLEDEVVALAAARYCLSTRRALAGHSVAGLFVVDALIAGAGFESYAALSPTLGWNRQHSLDALTQRFAARDLPPCRLYVSIADGDTPPYLAAYTRLETDLARQTPPWLRLELRRFSGEDHVTTIGPGLIAAMKWLFAQPPAGD